MNEEIKLISSFQIVVSRATELLKDREFRQSLRSLAKFVLQIVPEEETAASSPQAAAYDKSDPNASFNSSAAGLPASWLSSETTQEKSEPALGNKSFETSPPQSDNKNESVRDSYISAQDAVRLLSLGRGQSTDDPAGTVEKHPEFRGTGKGLTGDDLEFIKLVKTRCRLKAEAAHWAAERRRRLQRGVDFHTDIDPNDRQFIQRAKELPNCFLWTNHSDCPEPLDLTRFEELADNFENLVEAIGLIETICSAERLEDDLQDVLKLVAEAQSALREAVRQTGYEGYDSDQQATYHWLREAARRFSIYLDRYMKSDDLADPLASNELATRISQTDQELQSRVARQKNLRKLLKKVAYESSMIQQRNGDVAARRATILRAIEELVPAIIKPSNVELRESLLPILDHFDDLEEEHAVTSVLREIERYLARNPTADSAFNRDSRLSADVGLLREFLKGKSILMVGGELRRDRQEAIRDAFDLKELIWETVLPHTPLHEFEPKIAKPDVALVLLAIRWSSHCYTDLEQFCRQYDKPLVRLPGGTNPNQIAHQIKSQANYRLEKGMEVT